MSLEIIEAIIATAEPKGTMRVSRKVTIYACPECGAECIKKIGLRSHLRFKHPDIKIKAEER